MAVIVRTAGAERGKAEIKRDFEYLIRLWSNVRELTLESTAPTLIHEEARGNAATIGAAGDYNVAFVGHAWMVGAEDLDSVVVCCVCIN